MEQVYFFSLLLLVFFFFRFFCSCSQKKNPSLSLPAHKGSCILFCKFFLLPGPKIKKRFCKRFSRICSRKVFIFIFIFSSHPNTHFILFFVFGGEAVWPLWGEGREAGNGGAVLFICWSSKKWQSHSPSLFLPLSLSNLFFFYFSFLFNCG